MANLLVIFFLHGYKHFLTFENMMFKGCIALCVCVCVSHSVMSNSS